MPDNSIVLIVTITAAVLLVVHLILVIGKQRRLDAISKDKKTVYSLSPSDVVRPNPMIMKQMQDAERDKPFDNT